MSEPSFEDNRAYFAAIAETYDRLQPVVAGPGYQAGLDFALKLVPRDEAEAFTAVELGCGTASLTAAILDRFPNARAVAVDSEPAMLEVAQRKLARFGQRVEIRDDDAARCKLPACDLVLSAFMFHHIAPEHVPGTMRRIVGALATGGCLILLDTMQAGPPMVGARRCSEPPPVRRARRRCHRRRPRDSGGNRRPVGVQASDEGSGERRRVSALRGGHPEGDASIGVL